MSNCVGCGNSIPSVVSSCPECGYETQFVNVPEDPDWWDIEHVQQIVSQAESETVTAERLKSQKSGFLSRLFSPDKLEKRRSRDRPIMGYLSPGEVPHYIFPANNCIVVRDREESRYIRDERSTYALTAEEGNRPFAIVTDERILLLFVKTDGDYLASAPINRIVDIEADRSRPSHFEWIYDEDVELESNNLQLPVLKITTFTSKFEVYLDPKTKPPEINKLVRFIEDLAITSDQVRNQNEKEGDYQPEQSLDSSQSNRHSQPETELLEGVVLDDIRSTRESVDWETSIRTGLRVGSQTLQYAKLVPYSTPVTVGLATLTGTALKAHHTISGEATSIDPDELLDRGLAGAELGDRFDLANLSSTQTGASIGSARYIAERVTPMSYKHIVERTNPETIMKGTEVGTTLGQRAETPLTTKQGAIAGACAGLVYSYVPKDSPLREVDPDDVFAGKSVTDLMELLEGEN